MTFYRIPRFELSLDSRANSGSWIDAVSPHPQPFSQREQVSKHRISYLLSPMGVVMLLLTLLGSSAFAQKPAPNPETPKKANSRPAETAQPKPDPFDGASVEKMTGQCVKLETEQGAIVIEMLPAKAPEAVRNFLNLAATGSLDTTTFSRVVPGFVIQGGNLSTSEKWNQQLANRMVQASA